MADLPESPIYEDGIYQLETTDPVLGGETGPSNYQAKQLANRTAYLKQRLDAIENGETIPSSIAPVNSPTFTGDPKGPTAAAGDNDTSLATTAFVARLHGGMVSKSVAGGVNVTLSTAEAGYGQILLTGVITANIAVIFPAATGRWIVVNATTGAFTVTCKTAAGTGVTVQQGKSREIRGDGTNIYAAESDFQDTALTGTPTAPTAAAGTTNTQVANAAFLQQTVYSMTSIDVAGGSTTALTAEQLGYGILVLEGELEANKAVTVPANQKSWIVVNNCTGGFALTLKTVSGTGVILPSGQPVFAFCDGTNVNLAGSANQSTMEVTKIVAEADQDEFEAEYLPGALLVLKHGAMVNPDEYTATSGSQVIMNEPANEGDEFLFVAFKALQIADVEPELPHFPDTFLRRKSDNTGWDPLTLDQMLTTLGVGALNIDVITESGTWERPPNVDHIFYIAVGGGGGGGGCYAISSTHDAVGGGGAGGDVKFGWAKITGDIEIVIGSGGAGANGDAAENNGAKGGDTILSGGVSITAYGGGPGASGRGASSNIFRAINTTTGNAGGAGAYSSDTGGSCAAGGGGGAGGPGGDAFLPGSGNFFYRVSRAAQGNRGGVAQFIESGGSIAGEGGQGVLGFGGGAGGSSSLDSTDGGLTYAGIGRDGGANGRQASGGAHDGIDADPNTGGGGGGGLVKGGTSGNADGGAGGSGIVIIYWWGVPAE